MRTRPFGDNCKTPFDTDNVVHVNVSWDAYEALAAGLGDESHVRLTYDGATLEIMSPGHTHEFISNLLSEMLTVVSLEWKIALSNTGSATYKSEPKGFEADKSYYINAKTRVRDIKNVDLAIDPPPDIVVEVDISNQRDDKFKLYASLSVPEFWRYRRNNFEAFALVDCQYVRISVSRIIAGLPLGEIAKRLDSDEAENDILGFMGEWQQWLRDNQHLRQS